MSAFLTPLGKKIAPQGLDGFLMGTPSRFEQRSRLGPEQQPLLGNLIQSTQGRGAGGSFGDVADYYRDILSNQSSTIGDLISPEMRRFQQQTIPNLTAQFGAMGDGGLGSSAYRNALLNANTDLGERIAAIRAGLRQSAAEGLSGLGRAGLGDYYSNQFIPRSKGLIESIIPIIIKAIVGGAVGGPAGAALGGLSGVGSLTDSIGSDIATGPEGYGASYNPYIGVQ